MPSIDPEKIIPTSNSTAQEWIEWHKALRYYLGLKQANTLFTRAWSSRAGISSKANTTDLREYLRGVGLGVDTSGVQVLQDFTLGVGDEIGNFFKIGKWATIGIGVIVVGGLAMLIFNIAKAPAQSIGTAIKYAK